MSSQTLAGRRVLVVEDEYFIAQDICDVLTNAGAEVVGPAATLTEGIALAKTAERLDCAVLDLNLKGEPSLEIAEALRQRSVGYVLVTGYTDQSANTTGAPRLVKPFDPQSLEKALVSQIRDET